MNQSSSQHGFCHFWSGGGFMSFISHKCQAILEEVYTLDFLLWGNKGRTLTIVN